MFDWIYKHFQLHIISSFCHRKSDFGPSSSVELPEDVSPLQVIDDPLALEPIGKAIVEQSDCSDIKGKKKSQERKSMGHEKKW